MLLENYLFRKIVQTIDLFLGIMYYSLERLNFSRDNTLNVSLRDKSRLPGINLHDSLEK